MPSRRMIDPAFWKSENVSMWTFRQRLLFIGIFSNADDQGRLRAHPSLIRSMVFPYDDIPVEEITTDLQALAEVGAILLYKADGKNLLQVTNWWKYQRPKWAWPSELPPPPDWMDRCRYRRGNDTIKDNWDEDTAGAAPQDDGDDTTVEPQRNQDETATDSAPRTRDRVRDRVSGREEKTPPRDYLDDTLSFSQKDKPNGKPEGWDHVSDAVFAICIRVADLWCAGKLPTGRWTERVEKQRAGASELLGYHDGDLLAALATVDKYHLHYQDEGASFTVAGPQSLVNVIPPFMQSGGKKPHKRDLRRDGSEWTEEELAEARARSLAMEPLDVETFFEEGG